MPPLKAGLLRVVAAGLRNTTVRIVSGQANGINLSERTYSRVKDFLASQARGKVHAKDRRELDMYFATVLTVA